MRVADVSRPLISVHEMVEAGQTIVFSKNICYTKAADGVVTPLIRRNKGFDMDIQIQKPKKEAVVPKKSVGGIDQPMTEEDYSDRAAEELRDEIEAFEARVAQDLQDREDLEQGYFNF